MARGRRVNSCGEKSKKLLLKKAIELFSKHGYHQTKISDIVKAASLTQPTFYLYFQSKESLFHDLNEKFQTDLVEIFTNVSYENVDAQQGNQFIQENLKRIFDYFLENPHLTKIGFYDSEQSTVVKEMLVSRIVQLINKNLEDYPVVKYVEATVLAESLVGSLERLTLTNLLTNKSTSEKLAQDICMIYFAPERVLVPQ
ncbi:TetR/AcrR family transcriptional regulator [Solibacillus sp. FSL W7-1464]|uniref:TetR/AcrR family transcriptional regulator n=1 Tax=Solibacillus sp. FSL W7-1464 TaxID=2921706 RepID=UPI0030F8DF4E